MGVSRSYRELMNLRFMELADVCLHIVFYLYPTLTVETRHATSPVQGYQMLHIL